MNTPFKILFLCRGNSARSIIAEHLIRQIAPTQFQSFSAGSHPKDTPHPLALKVLAEIYEIDVSKARSKSWNEFRDTRFDFIITLCDKELEQCPEWPGKPILAHWDIPDPVAVEGTPQQQERAFWRVADQINRRLKMFTALPNEKLEVISAK
ncbi:MAG: arsenate reductase ArsC [Candidatus Methylacidiphilales bacterium]|nr:arsenate reductase ArsC [Candidatus Methylacidiphilales bacterium]